MARVQRAVGLLRALGGSSAIHNPSQLAAGQQIVRAYAVEAVAPAVTNTDIEDEFYLRQRSQIPLGNRHPHPAVGAWVSPSAVVVGDVDLYDRVSVWNHAVLRGDLNNIRIGHVSNVQERTVIHAARSAPSGLPAAVKVGTYVTIEPNCVLRSCIIGNFCKVGARSVLLEGSLMEEYSVLQPGSVLPPTRRVPSGEVWGGVPARFVRKLSHDEKDELKAEAVDINRAAWAARKEELPYGTAWRPIEAARAAAVASGETVDLPMRLAKYELRKEAELAESNAIQVAMPAQQATIK